MRWLTAVATTLLTTNAFVAPPRTRLHALAAVTTDDAIEQKLDSWLLDNLGSCAVPIDDDDDDAFELCSVDSPTAVWKSTTARRIDGVEVDAKIQHERAVNFDFHTGQQRAASTCTTCWPPRSRARRRRRRSFAFDGGR
ncbi:unnamed protein product, partial [Pelagomonas calceolata]